MEGALTDALSAIAKLAPALLAAPDAPPATAREASALLNSVCRRRWPPIVHERSCFDPICRYGLGQMAGMQGARQAALVSAVSCALLLPPRNADMSKYESMLPAWRRDCLGEIAQALLAGLLPASVDPAADPASLLLVVAGMQAPVRCICAMLGALGDAHKAIKQTLIQPLTPLLPSLSTALPALLQAPTPPYSSLASLLRLLLGIATFTGFGLRLGSSGEDCYRVGTEWP